MHSCYPQIFNYSSLHKDPKQKSSAAADADEGYGGGMGDLGGGGGGGGGGGEEYEEEVLKGKLQPLAVLHRGPGRVSAFAFSDDRHDLLAALGKSGFSVWPMGAVSERTPSQTRGGAKGIEVREPTAVKCESQRIAMGSHAIGSHASGPRYGSFGEQIVHGIRRPRRYVA